MSLNQRLAIIIGYSGQDGILLGEELSNSGTRIVGLDKDKVYCSYDDISQDLNHIDITCLQDVIELVEKYQPTEIYYLAAFHHSSQDTIDITPLDFYQECYSVHVAGLINFLEAIRIGHFKARLFYASSSLIFSGNSISNVTEKSPYNPIGFYAMTKVAGMYLCKEYRESYQIFASTGILFNHESALRHPSYLSQKIIRAAIRISEGSDENLIIGDLKAKVDWGYAPDYVKAFYEILNCNESDDFIVASGEAHSVEEFVELVFNYFNLDWRKYVQENHSILSRRLAAKIGNTLHLRNHTAWSYSKTFEEMVKQLIRDTQILLKIS